jgi:hypothetical protein
MLTTLNLQANQIGVRGAQYLADALKYNTVNDILQLLIVISLLSFNLGTQNFSSFIE